MQLNGWQRLWVVGGAVWLIVVALAAAKNFPTADEYRSTWLKFAEAEAPSMLPKRTPDLSECEDKARKLADPYGALMDCHSTATKPTDDDKKRYVETIAKGEAEIRDELPSAQAKAVGFAVLAWAIPAALVYGLGLLVVWVRRGFQQQVKP
jgi:hypothetical protein